MDNEKNKSDIKAAVITSAFLTLLWVPLILVGIIWGIVLAAQNKVGPALAVWMTCFVSFSAAIVIRVLIAYA
jgi:hypothetical protein